LEAVTVAPPVTRNVVLAGILTPKNKSLLAQFGLRALLAGTLASLLSATVVGMIIG